MKPVFVCGLGAVSPAGWGLGSLRDALDKREPVPPKPVPRPGHDPLSARLVPPPSGRPAFLAHPRLRRASAITHYAAAAALEATSPLPTGLRIGLVSCFQTGCVQYSTRFFEETLKDPSTASPLLFPETVFAAPGSHLATVLGNVSEVTALVGDPAVFLQGVALAADWLGEDRVDACLVLGAEEHHWAIADALAYFQPNAMLSSGAGALCVSGRPELSIGVELQAITDVHTFSATTSRVEAARAMRAQLPAGSPGELLCDGLDSSPRTDGPERAAWLDWPGLRLSPKNVLGEGLMAAAAWQCVAACDLLARKEAPAATVSLVGCNQQAIGARFVRT